MLMLLLSHHIMQKRSGKRDVIGPVCSGSFKVVFILLIKAVVVQIRISIIEIWEPGLQWLFSKLCFN